MARDEWTVFMERRRALTALTATAVFSLLAHGFLFANEFFSHDSVTYFTYAAGTPSFYLSVGRFGIPLYERLKGDVAAPWLIGILFVLWLTVTALLLCRLLEITARRELILTCALLCTNTALTLTGATYVYCMDEYALSLLFAAASAWFFTRRDWRGRICGAALLIGSLSLYQAYFTVAAALCYLVVLRRTAAGERLSRVLGEGLEYLAMLAGSFLLYYGLWSGACGYLEVEKRRVEESLLGGGGVLSLLKEANVRYVKGLFDGSGVLGWFLPVVHGLLVLWLLVRLWRILRRPGLSRGNRLSLLALICLLPTALNSIYVLMNGGATGLMRYGGELLYLLPLSCREGEEEKPPVYASRRAAAVLLCLVVWQHVVFANQVYMKKELEKGEMLVLAGQVIGRIEAVEGYVPGQTPVAFAGRLDHNGYFNRGRENFRPLEGTTGLWSDTAATYNLGRYLTDYLGYPLLWDQEADAAGLPGVEEMPLYPAVGSVELVEGLVVVKLSDG